MPQPLPPGWGNDQISQYLTNVQQNRLAAFVRLQPIWDHLARIDQQFEKATGNLHGLSGARSAFAAQFLIRSRSSFLAGVQTCTGGQLAETYMLLRGCLESSLYGFHVIQKKDALEIWLRRDEDATAKRRMRSNFAFGSLLTTLESLDPETGPVARRLYEQTIDYGAHPNPYSLLTQTTRTEQEDSVGHSLTWVAGDCIAMRLCLKTTAEVGLCALHIFRHAFSTRFDILGITEAIKVLRHPSQTTRYRIPHTGPTGTE
jgi:hypothetical protein